MNRCQCVTKMGDQGKRAASTQKGDNTSYCKQHQQCLIHINSPKQTTSPKHIAISPKMTILPEI